MKAIRIGNGVISLENMKEAEYVASSKTIIIHYHAGADPRPIASFHVKDINEATEKLNLIFRTYTAK